MNIKVTSFVSKVVFSASMAVGLTATPLVAASDLTTFVQPWSLPPIAPSAFLASSRSLIKTNATYTPTTVFSTNGFESYTNGTVIGQNGFTRYLGSSNNQFTVGSTSGVGGTKGVTASPATSTSYAYVANAFTPAAGQLVSTSLDIAATNPALSTTDPFGYLMDAYSNTGNRIGRVGLAFSSDTIVAVVTSKYNSTTGQFDPNGSVSNIIIASGLSANTFYNFEMRFDFTAKTFDVYSGGTLLSGGLPFASATPANDTAFSDMDMQISGASGAGTSGYFDNYLVQTLTPVLVPESAAVPWFIGSGVLLLGVRRLARRRPAA